MEDGMQYAWQAGVKPKPKRVRGKKVTDRRHDWSEAQVFEKLEAIFPSPAHVRLSGVRNDTGKTSGSRSIDALVASVYPSRGLWLAGVEIKITKSDWRKELRECEKQEPIRRFCKYWYVASPTGVIPVGEVPETWGVIEVRRDGATIVRPCPPKEFDEPDLPFMLSVMRNVDEEVERRTNEQLERASQQKAAEGTEDEE